ncbi:unnamed protein product [Mytilus coruscus]|uniref:Uncharacterized protein n=1 Tax=Mytilus coruscus TaxID=42192 RepID=A0A6J8BWL0_MYTCO|nr:unnamed protein product [Mytilus coruscus]
MDIPVLTLISVVTHLNWTSVCIIFDNETEQEAVQLHESLSKIGTFDVIYCKEEVTSSQIDLLANTLFHDAPDIITFVVHCRWENSQHFLKQQCRDNICLSIETLMWSDDRRRELTTVDVYFNGSLSLENDIFPNVKFGFNQRKFLASILPEQHWGDDCQRFKRLKIEGASKKAVALNARDMVTNPFKKGKPCVHCVKKNSHHRSLCPKKFKIKMTSVHLSGENSNHSIEELRRQEEFSVNTESNEDPPDNMFVSSSKMVLMQRAKTEVFNSKNMSKIETRILFESGSQRSYISQNLASKLNLKGDKEEEINLVTFGTNIVPVISGCVHRKSLDASAIEHLKHFVKEVELADELLFQDESSSIELLIENDYYLDLVLSNKVEMHPGLYLLDSKLGWIVTGRTRETYEEKSETGLLILSNTSSFEISDIEKPDQSIVAQAGIFDLWNLESIGITENIEASIDKKVMEYIKETLKFKNGR